jgi:hypothetical protein
MTSAITYGSGFLPLQAHIGSNLCDFLRAGAPNRIVTSRSKPNTVIPDQGFGERGDGEFREAFLATVRANDRKSNCRFFHGNYAPKIYCFLRNENARKY